MPQKKSFPTVTDMFCGAGGSSLGAVRAGAELSLAINHWKLAIETHNTNHPQALHVLTDISQTDPRRHPSTDILLASPECTSHSLAKGKKPTHYTKDLLGNTIVDPAEERSRATMWCVPRFAEYHDYNLIVVEAAKWRLWDSWLHAMHALGYDHKVVYFNSMFAFPTPQSRDRLYCVFWKKGNRAPNLEFTPPAHCPKCERQVGAVQSWKKKGRWGRYKTQYVYRCPVCASEVTPFYYAAFNAIDWSIQAERIGERKRPLRPKTLERVRYGLETYGRKPLIITGRYTSGVECRVKPAMEEALPTQPGDSSHAIMSPFIFPVNRTADQHRDVTEPYPTQTASLNMALVSPGFLSKQYSGDPEHRAVSLGDPTGAVTTWDHHALIGTPMMISVNDFDPRAIPALTAPGGVQTTQDKWALATPPAFIAELRNNNLAGGLDEALGCVTAGGRHHALIDTSAFLHYYYGSAQLSGMVDPVGTVTSVDRAALVQAMEGIEVEDCTFRMLQPHEIQRAMAFPEDYVILGNSREKTRQLGNALTPPVMQMIMERCLETLA
jgi:DNA (cytosine-5)-methyltransferase 1